MIGAIPSSSELDKFAALSKPGKLEELRAEVAKLEALVPKVQEERVRAETANDAASRRTRAAEAKEAEVELREAASAEKESKHQAKARQLRDAQDAHTSDVTATKLIEKEVADAQNARQTALDKSAMNFAFRVSGTGLGEGFYISPVLQVSGSPQQVGTRR